MPSASQETPERWRGRLAALGGPAGGQSADITLHAEQWTSDDTIAGLAATLIERGQEALREEVAALPSPGWVVVGQGPRYTMRTMRSFDLPDGTRLIRSVTDRPIQLGDTVNATISLRYAFGMVELYLTPDGTGEGRLIPAAQIDVAHGQVQLTSFGTQPFVIVKVETEKIEGKS